MRLYALHDKKACSFSAFHVERSDAVASRQFAEAVLAKDSPFAKYPEDFELVSVCDVHDCYREGELASHVSVGPVDHVLVITAEQVLNSHLARQKMDPQLSLMKEA